MNFKVIITVFVFFLFSTKESNGGVVYSKKVTFERPWLDYKWVVEEIDGVEVQNTMSEELNITMKPLSSSFSGYLGCNRMGGQLLVEENRIRFKNVIATQMSCSDQQTELLILNTLMTITNFGIIEDRLYLSNSSGIKIVLVRAS